MEALRPSTHKRGKRGLGAAGRLWPFRTGEVQVHKSEWLTPPRVVSENMTFGFLLRFLLSYSVFYYAIYYATGGTSE